MGSLFTPTLQFAAQLQFLLLQAADSPLVGLGGQAVLQAALDIQVHLVLTCLARLPSQLSQATPVGQVAAGEREQRRDDEEDVGGMSGSASAKKWQRRFIIREDRDIDADDKYWC